MYSPEKVIEYLGGKDNVVTLVHCATRLRFTLKDYGKVNKEEIGELPFVIQVVENGGQFQIVVGSEVGKAYQAIIPLLEESTEPANKEVKEEMGKTDSSDNKKMSIPQQLINVISSVFSPILPVITAAGLLKSFLAIPGVPIESSTVAFLQLLADAPFHYLPVLLAFTSAKRFKTDPYIAVTLGAMMVSPQFVNMLSDGKAVSILGIPVTLLPYDNSVFSPILAIFVLSYVYKWVEKISPKLIEFFFKPLITMVIMMPLIFIVIGPFGTIIGAGFAKLIYFIYAHMGWLAIAILSALMPFIVMFGMQKAFIPVVITALKTQGFEAVIGPAMLASNFSQGAAALTVYFIVKNNNKLKQLALSSSVTALLAGITEPALYGVNLKLKYPIYGSVVGAGLSGMYLGIMGVKGYTYGIPSILSMAGFIGPENDTLNFINAIIAVLISVSVTAIFTIYFYKRDKRKKAKEVI